MFEPLTEANRLHFINLAMREPATLTTAERAYLDDYRLRTLMNDGSVPPLKLSDDALALVPGEPFEPGVAARVWRDRKAKQIGDNR